eukprot:1462764-Prymnesium_polylepis.1
MRSCLDPRRGVALCVRRVFALASRCRSPHSALRLSALGTVGSEPSPQRAMRLCRCVPQCGVDDPPVSFHTVRMCMYRYTLATESGERASIIACLVGSD